MDFTEIYKQTRSLVQFSPGAHFISVGVENRLVVRRTETFQIARTWLVDSSPPATGGKSKPTPKTTASKSSANKESSDGWITHVDWSADSEHILAACAKRGVVHVYKMLDDEWEARIDSGIEGLVKAEWAPDARHILCFSEWGLRVTVWSLLTGTASYIQFPTHPDRGYAFRRDGRFFVLAERHKSKDTLGIYDAEESYKLARHFPLPTSSFGSLSLSPNGTHLAVWEGALEYKLYILTLTGTTLSTFVPPIDPGLGIKMVSWHPSGAFLAVGGWDERVYILDSLTWSAVTKVELQSRVPARTTTWREPKGWIEVTQGRGFLSYDRSQITHVTLNKPPDPAKPNPKSGLTQLEWNASGSYLLVRFELAPTTVYIYTLSTTPRFELQLRSVLIHSQPVSHARWNRNPKRPGSLAMCCQSTGALYTWSDEWEGEDGPEEIAECISVPAQKFETYDARWAPDGRGLILLDKEVFCCAFEVIEE